MCDFNNRAKSHRQKLINGHYKSVNTALGKMKRELLIISIIINFHFVTSNMARINIFEQLLKSSADWLDGYGEWWWWKKSSRLGD